MKVKLIKTKEFYSTMQKWWDGHNFPHVSPSMLPENTFVVFNGNGDATHSVCFYNTDSNLCWLGFPLGNNEVEKEDRKDCFSYLLEQVESVAKQLDYQIMFTTSNVPPVESVLTKNGYVKGDVNVNHYMKQL